MEYMTKFQHMPREIQQCIENCSECHQLCLATVYHCMELGGKYAMPAQITLLLDCAESCQTNANFLLRNSELQGLTAALCADSCTRCAQACERLANGDRQLLDCAKSAAAPQPPVTVWCAWLRPSRLRASLYFRPAKIALQHLPHVFLLYMR